MQNIQFTEVLASYVGTLISKIICLNHCANIYSRDPASLHSIRNNSFQKSPIVALPFGAPTQLNGGKC